MSGRGDDRISMYGPDGITLGPVARSLIPKARNDDATDKVEPVTECHKLRGSVLQEAITTINGERQDFYGSPEDSFKLIGEYWGLYLQSKGYDMRDEPLGKGETLVVLAEEVAMMMTLFKIARESNQHKRDNARDACGYMGLYADIKEEKGE